MRSKRLRNSMLLPTMGVLLALGGIAASKAAEPDFRQLAGRYVGLVRTGKPTPLVEISEMLSDDFVQSTSVGTVYSGKKANMALYRKSVAEIQAGFSRLDVRIDVQSVRKSPQIVILFGKITMSGDLRGRADAFRREIWETIIFRKEGNNWLMIHEHSTVAAQPDQGK